MSKNKMYEFKKLMQNFSNMICNTVSLKRFLEIISGFLFNLSVQRIKCNIKSIKNNSLNNSSSYPHLVNYHFTWPQSIQLEVNRDDSRWGWCLVRAYFFYLNVTE